MREVDQLHPMLEKELWVFGDEYASAVSEVGLTEALNRALGRSAGLPRQQVRCADGRRGRVDLMLRHRRRRAGQTSPRRRTEAAQRAPAGEGSHAGPLLRLQLVENQRYRHDEQTKWDFWLVGNAINDIVRWMIESHGQGGGLIQNDGRISIRVVTWGEVLDTCETQLKNHQERLIYASDHARSARYAERTHADADIVRLLAAHNHTA